MTTGAALTPLSCLVLAHREPEQVASAVGFPLHTLPFSVAALACHSPSQIGLILGVNKALPVTSWRCSACSMTRASWRRAGL